MRAAALTGRDDASTPSTEHVALSERSGAVGDVRGDSGSISLLRVDKTYEGRRGSTPVHALADVDLDIRPHSFVSFVGPSGCGKSTLLRIIGALTRPTRGRVMIGGTEVKAPRRDVGIMFQTPVLFPWRTVLQNVLLPAEIFGEERDAYELRANAVLDLVGLGDRKHAYPSELSGGMQQRAALSRVLAMNPSVILMDEPFGALDEFTRERMNVELLRIWQEQHQTIVFVTHSIQEAVFLSDQVVVMGAQPGRMLAVLDVPLPRPRQVSQMKSPEFAQMTFAVRGYLGIDR